MSSRRKQNRCATIQAMAFIATFIILFHNALAAEALPGDSCAGMPSGTFRQSSGPEITGGHMLVCDGTSWLSVMSYNADAEVTTIGNKTCNSGEVLAFDGSIWACSATGGGIWETDANVIRPTSGTADYATDDFVFGSPQLNDDGDTDHNNRMFFDKSKGAFRAGQATGTEWDTRGNYSVAFGRDSIASASYSAVLGGRGNTASGQNSAVLNGQGNTSTADHDIAWGYSNDATGGGSTAFGAQASASGIGSLAGGLFATASGDQSRSLGTETIVSGYASMGWGHDIIVGSGSPDATLTLGGGYGHYSTGIGLQSQNQSSRPKITGDRSFGLFMDQDATNKNSGFKLSGSDLFAIIGGRALIDPTSTEVDVSGGLELDVEGDIGAIEYCNEDGDFCFDAEDLMGINLSAVDDTEIMFNDSGVLASDSTFTFDSATSTLTVAGDATITGTLSSPGSGSNVERFGAGAIAGTSDSLAIGSSASANGGGGSTRNVAIGASTIAYNRSVAIGNLAATTGNGGVAIGYNAAAAANTFVSGSNNYPINDVRFGAGGNSISPAPVTIHGDDGAGTNRIGGTLKLAAGAATGNNATAGGIEFQTSDVGAGGATVQTLTTKMIIDNSGNVGIGTTTPNEALEVNGSIAFGTYVKINSSGFKQFMVDLADGSLVIDRDFLQLTNIPEIRSDQSLSIIGNDISSGSAPTQTMSIIAGDHGGNSSIDAGSVLLDAGVHTNGGISGHIALSTGDSERMRVTSSGSVGIGTATPQSTLHVPDGKYFQTEDNNAGAPPSGDCDADAELGRMSIDTTNNRLYVCMGASRGWDYSSLTD